MFITVFSLIFLAVVGSEKRIPYGKYCEHENPEEARQCVADHGIEEIREVALECAKKLKPDLDLTDSTERRNVFCKERKEYDDCLNEGAQALDNWEEIVDVINHCLGEK